MGDITQEQSMEEILSTIKKVIAKDQAARGTSIPRGRASRRPAIESQNASTADDVLELTAEMTPDDQVAVEEIVSTSVAQASRTALSALTAKRTKTTALPLVPDIGGKTIEQLVAEMLRPMLKDWLDANLPDMVERMVAKEIARISDEDR